MTYFYIYKITLTEGKLKNHYYIGQHKTDNLNDGYKGSGTIVQKYYKKHPNGYKKEILEWCGNEVDMNYYEDYFVGDKYKTDPMCLNLRAGGHQPGVSKETSKKISIAMKGKLVGEKNPMYGITPWNKGEKRPEETCNKISITMKGKNKGKKLSEEHCEKISEANKGKTLSEETCNKISITMKGKYKGKHWKLVDGKRVWY